MTSKRRKAFRNRLLLSIFLIIAGLTAVAFLAVNVTSELRLLNSARSDNLQWSLSQTEVEFLKLERALLEAHQTDQPDFKNLRRVFDIFYSRVSTLEQASIYEPLRKLPEFSSNLITLRGFLTQTAAIVDSKDDALQSGLPALSALAQDVRLTVRGLSNSGLNFFASEADNRRQNISGTLVRLAVSIAILVITLLLLALYLGYLNRLNARRSKEAWQAGKRMKTVTSTALDAVVVADAEGKILDFNAAAEQTFGYAAQDAVGRDLGELIVPDHHRKAHAAGMKRMRSSGETRVVGKGRVKMEAKRANGDIFPVELAIQSADTSDGEIFISFLRDISHRVAAEQDLIKARDRALAGEKTKTDFLATMSHEIRTPLNGLLGNLTLLQDTALNEKQQKYIKNMNTSGKLLMSHISDVLDITKYDAGKMRLRPVDMNISMLLQDIVDNQSGAAAAKNTALSWRWDGPQTDWIHADNERIQHVLMNIVGNAVKFTPRGNVSIRVSIKDAQTAPRLRIKVTDTGIGIDPNIQDQIFGDFMTGDNSYDRDVEGTGLGLGIAQRFVNAMGGTIDVDSTPDVGSTFTIEFPVTPIKAPKTAAAETQNMQEIPSLKILLVEDNEINRMVAREMLRAEGHEVIEAQDGQIAVELSQSQSYDLILMDISMPVMDGRTATRTIRAGDGPSARAPIVALTANAVAEEQEAFLSDGMNDVLTKPLSREGLIKLLACYAGASAQQMSPQTALPNNRHLAELRETLGAEAAQELITQFISEVDKTLEYLGRATQHPFDEVAKTAHRIAGSAAIMGATELRAALIAIENAAKNQDTPALTKAATTLPVVWEQSRPAFTKG